MKRWMALALLPTLLVARQVSYSEVVNEVLNNNEELKSKELDVTLAQEELKMAKGMELGRAALGLQAGFTNNALHVFGSKLSSREASFADFGFDGTAMAQIGGGNYNYQPDALNNPDPRLNIETSVSYELPLFTGYKLTSAQAMADLQIRAKKVKLSHDRKMLAKEVLRAYNGAVLAKEFIVALEKAQEATQGFVKMAQDFADAGMVLKSDVLEAQTHEADVKAKMIEAKGQFEMALAYLRFLSGSMDITDVGGFAGIEEKAIELERMKERALKERDDLVWMDYNVKTLKEKIVFDSADRYPMVGLMAKYAFNNNTITLSLDRDYYMIGIGLSYTLFDGGKREAEREKARVAYNQMELLQKYMTKGVALEVEKAWVDFKAKKGVVAQKEIALSFAEEVVAQTKNRYQFNLVPMTQLLLKEAETERARAELAKAKYDYYMAAAELKNAQGIDLAKDGE